MTLRWIIDAFSLPYLNLTKTWLLISYLKFFMNYFNNVMVNVYYILVAQSFNVFWHPLTFYIILYPLFYFFSLFFFKYKSVFSNNHITTLSMINAINCTHHFRFNHSSNCIYVHLNYRQSLIQKFQWTNKHSLWHFLLFVWNRDITKCFLEL